MNILIHYIAYPFLIFASATIVFDTIHYLLHRWHDNSFRLLRHFSKMHWDHHLFFNNQLTINQIYEGQNLKHHVIPEYITQVAITWVYYILFPLESIIITLAFETIIFATVLYLRGQDPNHRDNTKLKKFNNQPLVTTSYHGYHHLFPNNYFSSYFKIFDWVKGSAMQLNGKRIVLTGAGGALGAALLELLKGEQVASITTLKYQVDYSENNFDALDDKLCNKDILILAHGSKQNAMWANCISFQEIIKRYLDLNSKMQHLPEVWGVGSEIECHPAILPSVYEYKKSKRTYARWVRKFTAQKRVIYRHIVPAAFHSGMGYGLMTAKFVARSIIFLAKRDCRYIPITYSGIALLNYFKFKLLGGFISKPTV